MPRPFSLPSAANVPCPEVTETKDAGMPDKTLFQVKPSEEVKMTALSKPSAPIAAKTRPLILKTAVGKRNIL